MSIGAGGELLQTGHADPVRIPVQFRRRLRRQTVSPFPQEPGAEDLLQFRSAFFIPAKPGVHFLPVTAQSGPPLTDPFRQHADTPFPGHLPL